MGRLLRSWRAGLGVLALLVLAGAYFPAPLDDTFITAGYARSLVERGELAFFANGRAEGYSNFPWLLAQVPAVLLGVDLGLWAKLASLISGILFVVALDGWLPRDRRGGLAFVAILAWVPVAYWSAMGMETMAFTLLVAAGWRRLALGDARGAWWLAAAAWMHPEGAAYLAGGVVMRREAWRRMLLPVLAVLAWHACRTAYFGDLWPAPIRLKAMVGWFWIPQVVFELISALGILVATFGAYRGARWWGLAPIGIALLTLISANGDWMGCGRLLLPGLMAGAVTAVARGEPVTPRWMHAKVALILVCALLEPRFLALPTARAMVPRYHEGTQTPLAEVVAYLVDHTPSGGIVHSADIGFIGHIPDLSVIDSRGLVNRRFLMGKKSVTSLRPIYSSPDAPDVIMVGRFVPAWIARWQPELLVPPEGLDPWLRKLDDVLIDWPVRRDLVIRENDWVGVVRFHHRDETLPSPAIRHARWRELQDRFPTQPWLRARATRP